MTTLIHLVRHAEVENPDNIWYGRLEGFPLSEAGLRRTLALGEFFTSHPLEAVYASPLERAQQTAAAIALPHGLKVETCPDLIESASYLQGQHADRRILLKPRNWRYLANPFHPSWGEPYASVAARIKGVVDALRLAHPDQEVVAVSHMTPIMIGRLAVESRPLRPWLAHLRCARGSVTTLVFEEQRYVRTDYREVGGPAIRT